MIDELKKILKEKKKMTIKVNKSYKWIIISILLVTLGFLMPSYIIPKVPVISNLFKLIDSVWQMISGTNEIFSPLIYIGSVAIGQIGVIINTIKLVNRKFKLKEIEIEEQGKIIEIETQLKEIANEQKVTQKELEETKDATKEILQGIKDEVLNSVSIVEEKNNINHKPTNEPVVDEELVLNHGKVKERK